jgi:hypothetical protein
MLNTATRAVRFLRHTACALPWRSCPPPCDHRGCITSIWAGVRPLHLEAHFPFHIVALAEKEGGASPAAPEPA